MHRTTILLPDDLRIRAVRAAREMGVSLGELIRNALDALLEARSGRGPSADSLLRDRAVHPGKTPGDDSTHHDRYLYDEGG
jgi:hypothetical protein